MTEFSSRTARTPTRHYRRRLTISEHAIERFRGRVDEEFRHRDDTDLGNLLDERLGYAEFTYQVYDPRAPEAVTTLRSVGCRHATYYAVVRDETVVTVLDETMARNNFDPWMSVDLTAQGVKHLKPLPPPLSAAPPPVLPAAVLADRADASVAAIAVAAAMPDAALDANGPAPAAIPALAPDGVTTIEAAGAAYARARRQQHMCATAVATIRAELDRAVMALHAAEQAVEATHDHLADLVGSKAANS